MVYTSDLKSDGCNGHTGSSPVPGTKPLYTVQKAKGKSQNPKDEEFYGPVHWSKDSYYTLCGKPITTQFIILTNDGKNGIVTCKKCRRVNGVLSFRKKI